MTDATTTPPGKVFKPQALWLATFFGGPLAAGYLISENFKTFNEPEKARRAMWIAVIAGVLVFGFLFLVPDIDKVPPMVIPIGYTAAAAALLKQHQGKRIEHHVNAGGATYSGGRVAAVGVICLFITLVPIAEVAYAAAVVEDRNMVNKTYGTTQNEVAYDATTMNTAEVDEAARALTTIGFFDDAQKTYIHVKKEADTWVFSISFEPSIPLNDPATLDLYTQMRTELETELPGRRVVLNLVVGDLENVVKRLE